MTAVARTLASLSLEARAALWVYLEVAHEEQETPYFDGLCRLGVLLTGLRAAGGTWADVEQLIRLHDDHLDEFLNPYHARTRWLSYGGLIPNSPAVMEAAAA